MRNTYKVLVGKPELKRTLWRHRRRWKNDIRTGIREIGWKIVDRIHLAQDRDQRRTVVTVMNLLVP